MKSIKTLIQRLAVLTSLILMVGCGLQVRSNPAVITDPNPAAGIPEKVYTISGTALGVRYEAGDAVVPTGYFPNLPTEIVLTLNGEPLVIDQNGDFTFENKLKSGEDYEVSIVDNGIEIPHINGISPSIYLNCEFLNEIGTIVDQDIDDVVVRCFFGDMPYKDPE
jgi:hypothetical protein